MTLHDLVEILHKGRWIIVSAFVLVLTLTALYTFTLDPEYESKGLIQVNTEQSSPQLGDLIGLETGFRNVLNEIEILKSRTIAASVAEKLLLKRNTGEGQEFSVLAEPEDKPLTSEVVAARLRDEYVKISPVSQDVDFIEVVATSTEAAEAAFIANLYADSYLEYNLAKSRARMTASRKFLTEVADNFYTELQSAENALRTFLTNESVIAPDEEARQLLEQVTDFQSVAYRTQLDLGMARAELAQLEAELDRIRPGLARQISSGEDVLVDRLVEQIADLEVQLFQKYSKNPTLKANPDDDAEVVSLKSQIDALRTELDERAQSLVESALNETAQFSTGESMTSGSRLGTMTALQRAITEKRIESNALEARVSIAQENLAGLQSRLRELPNQELVLNRLSRTVQTQEELYVALIEKLQEARIAEQSELGYVEIIDAAVVAQRPVRPRIPLNLALGALLGLMLGVAIAFVRNAFDNKVRKPEDVRKVGLNVLGAIPNLDRVIKTDFDGKSQIQLNGSQYDTSLIALLNPLSPIAEGYRRLRTNILFSDPDRPLRTLMVTSAEPGEGKTVTSSNLAVAMAQSGRRTVYVDADLRKARGHRVFGVQREPGLTDVLFGTVSDDYDRFATHVDDLWIIPAGRTVPNPAEVLESNRMKEMLARLADHFDVVVVDTPPLLAVADALVMGQQVDATVFVTSANRTSIHAVSSATHMLRELGANVAGVVLNRFDPSRSGGYGYGYGYGYTYSYTYSNYYGDQSPSTKKRKQASAA